MSFETALSRRLRMMRLVGCIREDRHPEVLCNAKPRRRHGGPSSVM